MNRVFALTATATYANALGLMTQTSASVSLNIDPCYEFVAAAEESGNWNVYWQCVAD